MPRLITVATFDELYLAEMARAVLEDAGIAVFLADAETVGNQWHLGTAVGGVKVQVPEAEAERAAAALREAEQHRAVDEEELAREALAAAPEDAVPPPPPAEAQAAAEAEERSQQAVADERDAYARRFFRTALFATAVVPLAPLALYFFFNAAFGEGSLSAEGKGNVRRGLFVGVFLVPLWLFLLGPLTAAVLGL